MKRIICNGAYELSMLEVPKPKPKEGEALIRVRRIGICGTDMHAYRGNQPFFTYPRVLGHELAGEIEEIHGESSGLDIGQQVSIIPYMECGHCQACRNGKSNCCMNLAVLGVHVDGGMQEWINVPTDHLLPADGITLDETAIIEPLSIGAHAVSRSNLRSDDIVLVVGAGPIGLGVIVFAKQSGAKVIAMDVNEERLSFSQQWAGVDEVVHALRNPLDELKKMTGGDLPTVVFDATGNAASMQNAVNYAAHGGKLIYVGLVNQELKLFHPEFHKRELTLLSSRNATRDNFDMVLKAIRQKQIDTNAFITHRVGFDEMIGQFDQLIDPANKVIKAVVEV